MEKTFQNRQEKIQFLAVFIVYLAFLIWLILFKLSFSIQDIPRIRGLNLIPFHYDEASDFHLREILYNMVVFIPFGVCSAVIFSRQNRYLAFLAPILASLFFETMQYIFRLGGTDITDLIMNTLGGWGGILIFFLIRTVRSEKAVRTVNTIGIALEVLAILFAIMVFLFAYR